MKITKNYLRRLVKEELSAVNEGDFENDPLGGLQDVMRELPSAMNGVGGRGNLKILTDAGIHYLNMIKQNAAEGLYDYKG
jgi:hypothetical protein